MNPLPKAPSNKFLQAPAVRDKERLTRVKTKNTAPELIVRRYLHATGLRYRLYDERLPGKPDLVLARYRVVIFVQGCFWHHHGAACLQRRQIPKANAAFWQTKFSYNKARDACNQEMLLATGWRVLVVWECELKKSERGATLHRLTSSIAQEEDFDGV